MSALDADALSTLTDEEREAIQGGDYDAAEVDAMKKIAASATDDEGDDDDDDDEGTSTQPLEGKQADSAQDADAAVADAAAAGADDAPTAAAPAGAVAPRYEAKLPADFEAQVSNLAAEEAALKAKFKAGEIEFEEFDEKRGELQSQREALTIARAKAEISQEMSQQSAAQQWQNSVNRFMAQAAGEGLDYRKDADKAADLDQFVKVLANNPANGDKSMDWFLVEAHRRVQALHGLTRTAPAPAAKADPIADAKAKRQPPLDAAPKTLAQVPGGDGPGDVGDEFADVAALDGWELEQAIGKMSPAQREKFLRG